jgi:hypothetical protein
MNARFWFWCSGSPVKLKLRPGQAIHWYRGGPTDEGWSGKGYRWEFNGQEVSMSWIDEGRDCDGYMRSTGESRFKIEERYAGPRLEGIDFPIWRVEREEVFDEFAQAMNY